MGCGGSKKPTPATQGSQESAQKGGDALTAEEQVPLMAKVSGATKSGSTEGKAMGETMDAETKMHEAGKATISEGHKTEEAEKQVEAEKQAEAEKPMEAEKQAEAEKPMEAEKQAEAGKPMEAEKQAEAGKPMEAEKQAEAEKPELRPTVSFKSDEPKAEAKQQKGLTTRPSGTIDSPLPNVDPDEFVKMNPDGLYLVYSEKDGGTFIGRYSKEHIDGALAFVRPSEYVQIPGFKYKSPMTIQTRVNTGRSMYFQGWCLWLKEGRLLEGQLVLFKRLLELETEKPQQFPQMRICFLRGPKVDEVPQGLKNRPVRLKHTEAVLITGQNYAGIDSLLKDHDVDMRRLNEIATGATDKFLLVFK